MPVHAFQRTGKILRGVWFVGQRYDDVMFLTPYFDILQTDLTVSISLKDSGGIERNIKLRREQIHPGTR